MQRKKYFIIIIVAVTLLITYLHYSSTQGDHTLHNIYTELHYIPFLLGALVFGLKGAILTFIFIKFLIPHSLCCGVSLNPLF
ncbi:hypothetical protein BMS3Abin10_00030 [bacterium BMS3Abin10]|nr:hypothetical protein BMS3Abin10_00030 [bacterium BMS3Abin10]